MLQTKEGKNVPNITKVEFFYKDEPLPPDRIRPGDVLTFPLLKKLSAKADIEPPYEELSRSADPLELDFDMEEESEEDAYLKKTEVMKKWSGAGSEKKPYTHEINHDHPMIFHHTERGYLLPHSFIYSPSTTSSFWLCSSNIREYSPSALRFNSPGEPCSATLPSSSTIM